MYLSDFSIEFNIPVITLKNFLASKNIEVNPELSLSLEEEKLLRDNIEVIRSTDKVMRIEPPKLEALKILNKIDLEKIDLSTRPQKGIQWTSNEKKQTNLFPTETPRLMAAAKEFNIGKDTLVDYLVSRGFNRDDLKPTFKLTKEMYFSLMEKYDSDRVFKQNRELSKSNTHSFKAEEHNLWKGIIDSIQVDGRVKIYFIRQERTYNDGNTFIVDKTDTTRWTYALKEYWNDYNFIPGENIFFSIEQIDRDGKKIKVAIPPISNITNPDRHKYQEDKVKKDGDKSVSQFYFQANESNKVELDCNTINKSLMNNKISPLQKILFGSPGTGKSYQIVDAENSYFRQLIIDNQKPDLIKTVFHPEYTYGDFMGKLMPLTNKGKVEYRYYSGHFMLALGTAYRNIIRAYIEYVDKTEEIEKEFKAEKKKVKSEYTDEEKSELLKRISEVQKPIPKNVLLVIDEINRGNSAAIFGTVFQLLDRDSEGWSSYPVKISDLELQELLNVIGLYYVREGSEDEVGARFCGKKIDKKKYDEYVQAVFKDLDEDKNINILEKNIKMPPNLSIVATMNTSDNSIYFMDSAFKRRWDWEFIDITSEDQKSQQSGRKLEDGFSWDEFVDNVNEFIKKYGERIRKIEDKQIGYYFIKGDLIKHEAIRNKLMFFLWDSIFNNDKKPIKELIGMDKSLVTFGDFIKHYHSFIEAIKNKSFTKNVL